MSTTVPNSQYFVNGSNIKLTSADFQFESGKVRVELIDGDILYSQGAKVVTLNCEAPALPNGLQYNAIGAIVSEDDVEVMIFLPGGQTWTGSGVVLNTGVNQSAGAAQMQSFSIECPLKKAPR